MEQPKRRVLTTRMMNALLGAISDPRGRPNRDQIEGALEQLAEAAAAIIRVMPSGTRERFEMQLAMALERRYSPNQDEEE